MEIKGIKEGILITQAGLPWPETRTTLLGKIHETKDFFQGAHLVLGIGNTILRAKEIEQLRVDLAELGILLKGILSDSILTQKAAQSKGLITELAKPIEVSDLKIKSMDAVLAGEKAVMFHYTIPSGFKITNQGHVVVLGDINPGAEVIASGSIVIWGHLRGAVHAGAEGDETAVVCALDLSATQLRIANRMATTAKNQDSIRPEIAHIHDNKIIIEFWQQ